jgi:hypothetical protein
MRLEIKDSDHRHFAQDWRGGFFEGRLGLYARKGVGAIVGILGGVKQTIV